MPAAFVDIASEVLRLMTTGGEPQFANWNLDSTKAKASGMEAVQPLPNPVIARDG